ncbi:hypothetical protein V6Z98_009897 [Aspergillus fumigatus]
MRRPAAPTAPGAPGERRRPSNCPHCSPSEPVRTQVIPSDRPRGRWRAAAYGPRVGVQTPRTRPQRAAPAGRLPPGIWVSGLASGQRSTDSIGAGDQTAPGLRSSQRCGLPGVFKHSTKRPRDGRPSHVSGVTGAPIAGRSEPRRQPGRPDQDAARRPLESRNHGWDGRLPPFLKRGPTEGTCAPPVTERRPAWQGRSGRRRARTPPEVTRLSPST